MIIICVIWPVLTTHLVLNQHCWYLMTVWVNLRAVILQLEKNKISIIHKENKYPNSLGLIYAAVTFFRMENKL